MKPLNKIVLLFFVILINYSCAVRQQEPVYTQDESVDFQVFYDQLSPYGNWVNYSNYGYIWIPDVRREFAPYSTNGNWVMTDYGWTWISDYRWGWAPFHYGRWDYDNYYGWFWVPGNEWGPAWVTWRSGNGYYGWAPMRPGMDINSNFDDGYRDFNRWSFVRDRDFGRNDIHRYYINRNNYNTIINNTSVINNTTVDRRRNTTYVAGPPLENVKQTTGRNINRVRIQDNKRPGQKLNNEQLTIFRPQIKRATDTNPIPPKVTDIDQIKPVRERGSGNRDNAIQQNENNQQGRTSGFGQTSERRRSDNQTIQRQRTEKSTNIEQQPTTVPQNTPITVPNQNDRRRNRKPQDQSIRDVKPAQPQQQGVPPTSQVERGKIQQEQVEQQDKTKQEQIIKQQQHQVQRQEQQIQRQQNQIERQQQIQRRRQERQTIRQKQPIEQSQPLPQIQPSQQQNEEERKVPASSEKRRR